MRDKAFSGKGTDCVTWLRYQIREPGVSYLVDFSPKNDDIAAVIQSEAQHHFIYSRLRIIKLYLCRVSYDLDYLFELGWVSATLRFQKFDFGWYLLYRGCADKDEGRQIQLLFTDPYHQTHGNSLN